MAARTSKPRITFRKGILRLNQLQLHPFKHSPAATTVASVSCSMVTFTTACQRNDDRIFGCANNPLKFYEIFALSLLRHSHILFLSSSDDTLIISFL